ncbi:MULTISPECIES: hypothetical protein [Rhizobium/Agrobacterium group]|jgi:hypothetical protein|uniref:hypothetical protein n=1 Tax=Rhizobium/Agrobacterium group TaxID=227290 RepID=UPI000876056C|nr:MULTISPECIES: hypothetical protein [Rhizobium/Agrobacterium group]AYM07078.1 hypothetical protein At1D1460_28360 [Agrobacterium tumefaciens]NSZ33807.1 hypothetical protein [Agrobacterium tumefaciens]QLG23580.1 hypothetical protein EML4_14305 [Agrobacterium tumefaciens]UXS89108.1 hypothetical protein FY144_23200 [Agrobacterium tumefaciens]SCY80027.1 hypothetical protein SAMN03159288_04332 [Rhizobium sp. NFACC06-2]
MDEGVAAVRLRFPTRVQAINELASRDVIFCEICQDFAEAQTELARWEAASSDPVRDDRVAEYRELLAALGREIEDALTRATVVSLHRSPGPRPV